MNDTLFLTWRYMAFNRGRIALLVALVTLAAVLPLSLQLRLPDLFSDPASEAYSTSTSAGALGTERDPSEGEAVLDAAVTIVGATSFLIMTVALALARRFRRAEMDILSGLGCSRARIRTLLTLEMLFVVLASSVIVAVIFGVIRGLFGVPLSG